MPWTRPRNPAPVTLMPYDYNIFRELLRYEALRWDLLHRLCPERPRGGNSNEFRKPLSRLWEVGWLERPEGQFGFHNADHSILYYQITQVARAQYLSHFPLPKLVTQVHKAGNFAHDIAGVANVLASIEAGARKEGYTLISWQDVADEGRGLPKDPFFIPTKINGQNTHFRPDGFFGLVRGDEEPNWFFIEHERGNGVNVQNTNQASWKRKLITYEHFYENELYKTQLKLKRAPRLLVTTVGVHKSNWQLRYTEGELGATRRYLFRNVPDIGNEVGFKEEYPDLFASLWNVAGNEPTKLI